MTNKEIKIGQLYESKDHRFDDPYNNYFPHYIVMPIKIHDSGNVSVLVNGVIIELFYPLGNIEFFEDFKEMARKL